ncbi:MAG: hypothetical protein KGL18_08855 [Burkholderiales bacterium]|nr:hypothetical protein [Burkholderiales bacterium]MDE1925857.1 hypothetical protein [Burkholderiales bacterium]MDE2503068.1 hypothetical protein [Burkholderiales bacterium]
MRAPDSSDRGAPTVQRDPSYLQAVMAVYQGEVLGEAMFSQLAATAPTPWLQGLYSTMLQFETETKMRLRPFIHRLGLSVAEDESARAEGLRVARRYEALEPAAWIELFEREIGEYVDRYQALADRAPPEDAGVLEGMAEHERVFLCVVAAMRAGDEAGAVETVARRLAFPLVFAARPTSREH